MLKKILVTIISGVCIVALNPFVVVDTCSAEISKSELCLGGVTSQSLRNDVMRMYGKPTWESQGGSEWCYGNSVSIVFDEEMVSSVTVTANNGWATPAGLTVGMNANTAINLYGDPDKSVTRDNKTLYVYFVNYLQGGKGHLAIVFDKSSKKISKLNIKKSHMADFREYYSNWVNSMFN